MAKNGSNKPKRTKSKTGAGKLRKAKSERDNAKKRSAKGKNSGNVRHAKGVKKVEIKNSYSSVNTNRKLKSLIKKKGRLRYKGKFISKEAQDKIIEFTSVLDREGVEYSLNDILAIPDVQSKILVIKDETPKELFYWNVQSIVNKNKLGDPHIVIKDFNGKVVYKGESSAKATIILNRLNKKLQDLEKDISENENIEPYFTVGMFEIKRDAEVIKIVTDYSSIRGQIPQDIISKYTNKLKNK